MGRRPWTFSVAVAVVGLARTAADDATDDAAGSEQRAAASAEYEPIPAWDTAREYPEDEEVELCLEYLKIGDAKGKANDWEAAQTYYYLALGPDPDTILAAFMFDTDSFIAPMYRLFDSFAMVQIAQGIITLNQWPSTDERASASRAFVTKHFDDSKWFKLYKGQKKALKALPPLTGSETGPVDFVTSLDDLELFSDTYLNSNRPVVVGAAASDVLLDKMLAKTKLKWSKKSLMRSKFKVNVGSIPYYHENFAVLADHATEEEEATVRRALDRHDQIQRKGNYHTRKEQPLAGLEQCAGGIDARECVALVDRYKAGKQKATLPMKVSKYITEVMRTDTWSDQDFPDLRATFGTANDGLVDEMGLDHDDLPWPLRNIKEPDPASEFFGTCKCPGCACHFQFYLAPALTGSHPHAHKAAWNALFRGRKRWYYLHPYWTDHSEIWNVTGDPHGPNSHTAVPGFRSGYTSTVKEWLFEGCIDKLLEQGIELMSFDQYPGEVVFVPDNWPHAVMNLEPSVGIAVEINRPARVVPDLLWTS